VIVSVEIPAFKGEWLQRCIDSVLYQSSPDWRLSLLWDGGDELSRRVLEKLQKRNHPKVTVHFGPNRGIAKSRRFLSEHSQGDYILPVDDDDVLRALRRAPAPHEGRNAESVALAAAMSFSVTPPASCVDQVTVTFL
jgi:glycosyltransferase involved in cell wall biosynthesis